MATYSKETALYDTGAIANGITAAGQTAESYISTVSGGGIMVHPANDATSGWKISSALELLKSGVTYIKAWLAGTNSDIPTVQIGADNAGHSVIDSAGLRVYGGDGTEQLAHIGYGETINDDGQTVLSRHFTFGRRYGTIGSMSVVEGSSTASGVYSHAEGAFAQAEGGYSHAENISTRAVGLGSHAQGFGTIASKSSQTALGTYNAEDTSSTTTHPNGDTSYGQYAVIVGNGFYNGGTLVPSNALTVDWSGHVNAAGGYTVNGNPIIETAAKTESTGSFTGYKNLAITPTAPHGKTLIAIGSLHVNGNGSSNCQLIGFYIDSGAIHVQMKNTSSTSYTWTIDVIGVYA